MEEVKYINALNQLRCIGPKGFMKLDNYFDCFKDAWEASTRHFEKAGIGGEKALEEIDTRRADIDPEKEWERLQKEGIEVITKDRPSYPQILTEIPDPPYILYIKGAKDALKGNCLGVVGTRSFTTYGKEVTPYLVKPLVNQGLTIVSGLAKGIDTFAHKACLEAGGITVAVLATGVERVYPKSNTKLAQRIIKKGGAIISENPIGTEPQRWTFPPRNRIISGLSLGVLVVEAGKKSGALITARAALDQNREVFAVPGDILSSASKGPNQLLKEGAKAACQPDDILEELDVEKVTLQKQARKVIPETKQERQIIEVLEEGARHIDKIIEGTNLPPRTVSAILTTMTIKGKVKEMGGGMYGLNR